MHGRRKRWQYNCNCTAWRCNKSSANDGKWWPKSSHGFWWFLGCWTTFVWRHLVASDETESPSVEGSLQPEPFSILGISHVRNTPCLSLCICILLVRSHEKRYQSNQNWMWVWSGSKATVTWFTVPFLSDTIRRISPMLASNLENAIHPFELPHSCLSSNHYNCSVINSRNSFLVNFSFRLWEHACRVLLVVTVGGVYPLGCIWASPWLGLQLLEAEVTFKAYQRMMNSLGCPGMQEVKGRVVHGKLNQEVCFAFSECYC